MGSRLVSVLRLVRLPNTLTAAADVMAGAVLAGGDLLRAPGAILAAAGGSALIYGGGVALNDVIDYRKDRELNPGRPLPSGALSRGLAAAIAFILLGLGGATMLAGAEGHAIITCALIACVIAYDALPTRLEGLGVLLMGVCRALNLLRGATLFGDGIPQLALFAAAAHLWLVAAITMVSMLEDAEDPPPARLRKASLILMAAYAAPPLIAGGPWSIFGLLTALGSVMLAIHVVAPLFTTPPAPRMSVKRAVFTLILLDALYVLAAGQWLAALAVSLLFPLLLLLARALRQRES